MIWNDPEDQHERLAYEQYVEEQMSLAIDNALEKVRYVFPVMFCEVADCIAVGWESRIASAELLADQVGLSEGELWALLGNFERFEQYLEENKNEREYEDN